MAQDRIEVEVYRDIEKFYKVLGYYHGQELKPVATLEAHVDKSLETTLRNESVYIRRLQYLLYMTEAQCEGRPVFQTDRPETALTYALFSEGIQALAILRDLTSVDLREWSELVRQTLIDFDEGRSNKDLASVLWRSPSRNVRCKIYNALLDLETNDDSVIHGDEDELKTKKKSNWHTRDQEWETPDGEKVDRKIQSRVLGENAVSAAKSQLMSMAMNPMLPDEFKVGKKELEFLSEELSAFDQNHVDYNLLQWYLRQLAAPADSGEVRRLVEQLLTTLSQGVISRFHPGLIFLLLDTIRNLEPARFKTLQTELVNTITSTLRKPANEKRLLASLKHPERAELTKKLLPFLDPKQFTSIVHFYLGTQDREGLSYFLKVIFEKHTESINHMLFSWGEDLLVEVYPSLRGIRWSGRTEFLLRGLKSTSVKIQKEAAKLVGEMAMAPEQGVMVYEAASDEAKEAWLQGLIESAPVESWRAFVVRAIESGHWLRTLNPMLRGKIQLLWLKLSTHYLQANAWLPFVSWIQRRKFWFWPADHVLREAILNHFVGHKLVRANKEFQKLCDSESRLKFQSEELKNQLSVVARGR